MDRNDRTVFVLGAGFSAPAKLPVQDQILPEMINDTSDGIMIFDPRRESTKYLRSYIAVGIYLLQNYTSIDCEPLKNRYEELVLKMAYANKIDHSIMSDTVGEDELIFLRERIQRYLEESNIQISLEDVFTSFDKAYQNREFFHGYSSQYADEIKESITRLFVYSFGESCKNHSYTESDYLSFFDFISRNPTSCSIVSTNWDVLVETYLEKLKIKYDLCLNEKYYSGVEMGGRDQTDRIKLMKIHGSINWFRCRSCGAINVVDANTSGSYLFDDSFQESCESCKEKRDKDYLLQPQIITPTMMKSLNSQLYTNIWSSARGAIRKATHVYFIGYSLPIADFDFRYMLHQSISDNAKIDVILYHDDDPNQTDNPKLKGLLPEKRYRDLFAKNEMDFYYNGFGTYFGE